MVDEAHNNFHTISGRYRPFAELLDADGCTVSAGNEAFTPASLADYDVLVIAGASGGDDQDAPDAILALPAFEPSECDVVRDWVHAGGALLLIADHAPNGAAAHALAQRFDVELRNVFTKDASAHEPGRNVYTLPFTRANGNLTAHAITDGRNKDERVEKVVTFTGQSLAAPAAAVELLRLGPTAVDVDDREDTNPRSAAGRSQALALEFGRGRVIVAGEAAMFTAQCIRVDGRDRCFGMSYPDCDNATFALNCVRWLARLL